MTSWTTGLSRRWPLLVVAVVVIGGGIGVHSDAEGHDRILAAALAIVGVAGIVVASYRPRIGVLLAGVAAFVYFAASLHPGPMFLVVPVAVGVAAIRLRPRELTPVAAVALALLGAGLAVGDSVGVWPVLGTSTMAAAAATLVWLFIARNEAADQAAQRAASDEQLRMAQELHDGVGHRLAVIAMQAGAALHLLDRDDQADPQTVRANLQAIRDTSRESLDALRSELTRIASPDAAPRAPAQGLSDLPALAERVQAGGLAVDLTTTVTGVPDAVGQVVYAVVQEALTNVLRHASAAHASALVVQQDRTLVVTVTDDGIGGGSVSEGMGLSGMRRRIEQLGGRLVAEPATQGFQVRAELPL